MQLCFMQNQAPPFEQIIFFPLFLFVLDIVEHLFYNTFNKPHATMIMA